MCLFGGGGSSSSSNKPESKGPSDQTAPMRDENYRLPQTKYDATGRDAKNSAGRTYKATAGKGTLLTTGKKTSEDSKKTLLGA